LQLRYCIVDIAMLSRRALAAASATRVRSAGGVVVPPAAGNGTLLAFVKA
jgi:hypothetical protein